MTKYGTVNVKNTVNSEMITIFFSIFVSSVKSHICNINKFAISARFFYITRRQSDFVIMLGINFHSKNKTLKKISEFTVLTHESLVDYSTCWVYFINIRIVYTANNKTCDDSISHNSFIYSNTLCMRAAKETANLCRLGRAFSAHLCDKCHMGEFSKFPKI